LTIDCANHYRTHQETIIKHLGVFKLLSDAELTSIHGHKEVRCNAFRVVLCRLSRVSMLAVCAQYNLWKHLHFSCCKSFIH